MPTTTTPPGTLITFKTPTIITTQDYINAIGLPVGQDNLQIGIEDLPKYITFAQNDLNAITNGTIYKSWVVTDQQDPNYLTPQQVYYIQQATLYTVEYYIQTAHIFATIEANSGTTNIRSSVDRQEEVGKRQDIMRLLTLAGVYSPLYVEKPATSTSTNAWSDLPNLPLDALNNYYLNRAGTLAMFGTLNMGVGGNNIINVANIQGGASSQPSELINFTLGATTQANPAFISYLRAQLQLTGELWEVFQGQILTPVSAFNIKDLLVNGVEVVSSINSINGVLNTMGQDVILIKNEVVSLDTTVQTFDTRITTNTTNIINNTNNISQIDNHIASISTNITTLNNDVLTLQNDNNINKTKITANESAISTLEQDVQTNTNNITSNTQAINENGARIYTTEQNISTLQNNEFTISAGSNITITQGTGNDKVISASGGGSDILASNNTFTGVNTFNQGVNYGSASQMGESTIGTEGVIGLKFTTAAGIIINSNQFNNKYIMLDIMNMAITYATTSTNSKTLTLDQIYNVINSQPKVALLYGNQGVITTNPGSTVAINSDMFLDPQTQTTPTWLNINQYFNIELTQPGEYVITVDFYGSGGDTSGLQFLTTTNGNPSYLAFSNRSPVMTNQNYTGSTNGSVKTTASQMVEKIYVMTANATNKINLYLSNGGSIDLDTQGLEIVFKPYL